MKIAYVHDVAYPWIKGGAELRNYEIAKRLARRHEVHIFCVKWWKGSDEMKKDGIFYHGICKSAELYKNRKRSVREALRFSFSIAPHLSKQRFDIIECFQSPYFHCFPSWLVARASGAKLAYSWFEVWRNFWYEYLGSAGFVGKILERALLKLPDFIITGSEKTRTDLKAIGFPDSSIYLVHNGISLSAISKIRPSREKFDIAYVGRLIKGKRVDLLIEATSILREDFPKMRVAIISDGPERKNLESLAKELGVEKNIKFFGFVENHDDILAVLKSSKIFVNPSVQEGGASIVLFEANACGLPAIAVRHPNGIDRQLIKDSENGFFVEISAGAIAGKIRLLLKNKKILEKMSAISKDSVRKYDWNNIAITAEKAYLSALTKTKNS